MSNEEQLKPRYYQNRRFKARKMQREIKKSQRRLNKIRACYRFMLVAMICAFSLFILKMPQWRLPSNTFDSIKNPSLEIVNNKIVPSQKILAALRRNEVPKKPIFLIKTNNLKESILQLDPVKMVYIRRFWFPARLKIIVIERTPIITISPNINVPPIAFFTSDGKLVGHEYMPLDDDFKTVLVITYGSRDDYRTWDKIKINNFKKLAEMIESETGEEVEYIDYRDPKDVYVKIPTVAIRLGSFNTSTYDKVLRLPSLLPQVKMINKKVKYIDLRWDNSNYIKLDE